jgi:SAM-dependent methyltransferase
MITPEIQAPLSPNARLRYALISRALKPLAEASSLLEIGCGQGALATILARQFDYRGYEPDQTSFGVAHERLARLGRGRVVNTAVPAEPDQPFDIVVAFEVLEHMADDVATLAAWKDWIRPGGHVVLSVPAHPHRFGPGDEYGGHYRRYTREGLRALLESAGMTDVQIWIYGFPLGYMLEEARNRLLSRRITSAPSSPEARTAGSGRILQLNSRLAPLLWVATLPFRVIQRPFADGELGIGFVARARRPS